MGGRSFNEEASLPQERYFATDYFERSQFDAFVSQILTVASLKPKHILEIGPGNGFVSGFFRSAGYKVTTFDINKNLNPDVVGNILEIDRYFEKSSFDLILCAEVLEHLPFEHFESIIQKYSQLTKAHVVITLPRRHRILLDFRMHLKIPFIKALKSNIFYRIPDRNKWEGHHWEIDYHPNVSLGNIKKVVTKYFSILDCFPDDRVRHHQFFILKKRVA
jgi:hypothetical protein